MISDRYIDSIRRAQFDFSDKYKYIAVLTNSAYFVRKHLYENIRYFSPKMKGRVLDFGCGAKPYRDLFYKCKEYIGLDIEKSGHDHKNEEIDVYYNGKDIPFETEYFDSVFSSEVFEHVDNLDSIMVELNRILKKGGYLLATVPFVWREHEVPYDFRRFTSYGIIKFMEQYGFRVLKVKKSTSYIELLVQLFMSYIKNVVTEKTRNRTIHIFVQRMIIAPIAVMGILLNHILPSNDSLYGDIVILCRKI